MSVSGSFEFGIGETYENDHNSSRCFLLHFSWSRTRRAAARQRRLHAGFQFDGYYCSAAHRVVDSRANVQKFISDARSVPGVVSVTTCIQTV
jgi:hypothetical protein